MDDMDSVDYADADHLPRRLSTVPNDPDMGQNLTSTTEFIKAVPTALLLPRGNGQGSSCDKDAKGDHSFDMTDIDLNLGQYSLAFTDFWADRDVRCDRETEQYTRKLQSKPMNIDKLKPELFHLCRRNFAKRLKILCELLLEDVKVKLHDLELRGDASQTCLHAALIHDSPGAAHVLINTGGKELILTPYSKKEFFGVTSLHIAVVKGNCDLVRLMLDRLTWRERLWLVKAQATGPYFRRRFSASGLALTLAAWSNQMHAFDLLLQYGAQLDDRDSTTGNNVIHSLVEYATMDSSKACLLFTGLLSRESCKVWWCRKNGIDHDDLTEDSITIMRNYVLRQTNHQGYTPLHLAARLGSCCMFKALIMSEGVYRFTQWQYGPASTVHYDISELDSALAPPGTLSALELLLRTVPESKLDIFSVEPMNTLIRAKWASYKFLYYLTSLIHLVVMAVFTVAVFYGGPQRVLLGNHKNESGVQSGNVSPLIIDVEKSVSDGDGASPGEGYLRSGNVTASTAGSVVIIYILIRLLPWLYNSARKLVHLFRGRLHRGPSVAYSTSLYDFFGLEPLDPVSLIYYVSVISWFCLYLMGSRTATILGGMGLLSGWYLLLVYLMPLKSVGLFSVVLNRMLTHDLLRFFVIFVVIFVAFTTSIMCFLGPDQPLETSTFFQSYWALLRVMVGLYDLDDALERAAYPIVARVVSFLFIIVTMIQLLNMLIAAMTNTFAEISAVSDHLWMKMLAEATISIESHLPRCLRPKMTLARHPGAGDDGVDQDNKWVLTVDTI